MSALSIFELAVAHAVTSAENHGFAANDCERAERALGAQDVANLIVGTACDEKTHADLEGTVTNCRDALHRARVRMDRDRARLDGMVELVFAMLEEDG